MVLHVKNKNQNIPLNILWIVIAQTCALEKMIALPRSQLGHILISDLGLKGWMYLKVLSLICFLRSFS